MEGRRIAVAGFFIHRRAAENETTAVFFDTAKNAMSFDDLPPDDSPPDELLPKDSPLIDGEALPLPEAIHSTFAEVLAAAASDPALTEDLALVLLKRSDLPALALVDLSKNNAVAKSRKVKAALVEHPRTPRHVSIPLIRHLFTFDLMQVALTPAVPADMKLIAEESLINRLERLSQGERLSLARRASGRIAAELLLDPETRVIQAALENGRLTEVTLIKTLMRRDATSALVAAVCQNPKWSVRRELRVVLLRSEWTPPVFALEFARSLPTDLIRETLNDSRLPVDVKQSLLNARQERDDDSGEEF
jgi:hypothetical protein